MPRLVDSFRDEPIISYRIASTQLGGSVSKFECLLLVSLFCSVVGPRAGITRAVEGLIFKLSFTSQSLPIHICVLCIDVEPFHHEMARGSFCRYRSYTLNYWTLDDCYDQKQLTARCGPKLQWTSIKQ